MACSPRWIQPAMATANIVKGWIGGLMTEKSSFHCQPSVDASNPERSGARVLSSFVFWGLAAHERKAGASPI